MEFGEKLKLLRRGKGLSQQELSDKIFVSRSAVAKWENGKGIPDTANLDSLGALFGVNTEELLSEAERNAFRRRTLSKKFSVVGIVFSLVCLVVLFLPMTDHEPLHGPTAMADVYRTIPAFLMLNLWGSFFMLPIASALVYFTYSFFNGANGVRMKSVALVIIAILFVIALVLIVMATEGSPYDWFFVPKS